MFQGIPAMMVSGGGASSAAPTWTQRATEDFSGHTNLSDLTTSGNWTSYNGSIVYLTADNTGINSSGVDNLYGYTGVSFTGNQYSQVTMATGSGGAKFVGVSVRAVTGPFGYLFYYEGTNAKLNAWGALLQSTPKSYVAGNKLRIEAVGSGSATRLTCYEDTGSGWVAVFTSIDPGATYHDGGSPGLYGFGANDGFRYDDWSAGDQ